MKEYELIAGVFAKHRKTYGGRTDSIVMELIDDMTNTLEETYPNFDHHKFLGAARHGLDEDYQPLCPQYAAKVLPDEENMCSLCGEHKAW